MAPGDVGRSSWGCGRGNVLQRLARMPMAAAYHERWEHESGNRQLKTCLRGPGKILRSQSPDIVREEIWGYLGAERGGDERVPQRCRLIGSAIPARLAMRRTI